MLKSLLTLFLSFCLSQKLDFTIWPRSEECVFDYLQIGQDFKFKYSLIRGKSSGTILNVKASNGILVKVKYIIYRYL